jgi:hypothetical protein
MGKNTSSKTRNSLLATTLFPPRFGLPNEFAHLAKTVIENGYLNGTGKSLSLLLFMREIKSDYRVNLYSTVIRIDGGGRMAKM